MIQNLIIGKFIINSYDAMFYLGCIFFIVLLLLHRKTYDFPLWKALVMSFIAIPLGYGATSLLFAFEVGISQLNFSGFSWYGAVFFMPIAMLILSSPMQRFLKIDAHDYIHNLAAPLALMNGFMKVGCTLYGCCHGPECSWGFYNTYAGTNVFPIQLIEAIWNFTVCGFILWYERKPENRKNVYPMYMIVYSVGRILCEFGRSNAEINFRPIFGVITGGMLYALTAIIIGTIWLRNNKKKEEMKLLKATPRKVGKSGWRQ